MICHFLFTFYSIGKVVPVVVVVGEWGLVGCALLNFGVPPSITSRLLPLFDC